MTDERAELLNELEFSWEVRPKAEREKTTWDQRYSELNHFHDDYKHFHIPAETMPHLYAWALEQKQLLRNLEKYHGTDHSKLMGPERVAALAALGFTEDVDLGDGDDHNAAGRPDQHHYHQHLDILDPVGYVHDHHDHEHESVNIMEPLAKLPGCSERGATGTGDCTLQAYGTQRKAVGDAFACTVANV